VESARELRACSPRTVTQSPCWTATPQPQPASHRRSTTGTTSLAVTADVSAVDDVQEVIDHVSRTLGPIGILVNNAGFTGQVLYVSGAPHG
jgi:NAD(P)-dependent dehydrogenase (short-subunit alcohol dehydrogenase family)